MTKQFWKGSAQLSPVPPTLVTCGTMEKANILTVAWTGIVATHPPMTYISIRKSRYSYDIINNSGEFAINLATSEMCRIVDYCGVKSGRDIDKIKECQLKLTDAKTISAPLLSDSPISLECKVKQVIDCGSHMMFLSEITCVAADERYIDKNGKLDLSNNSNSPLLAFAHGEYYQMGKKVGSFGYSVRKKKKKKSRSKPKSNFR